MNNSENKLNDFIKSGLSVGSRFLWICSILFSMAGILGLLTRQNKISIWLIALFGLVAFGLAAVVIVLELAVNRMKLRRPEDVSEATLWLLGACSYVYDIYTNVAGLSLFMLGTVDILDQKLTPWVAAVWFFGILIAVGPEPMYNQASKMRYLNGTYRSGYTTPTAKYPTSAGSYTGAPTKEQLARLAELRNAKR